MVATIDKMERLPLEVLRNLPPFRPLREIALSAGLLPSLEESLKVRFDLAGVFSENQNIKSVFQFDELMEFIRRFKYDPAMDSAYRNDLAKDPERRIKNYYEQFKHLKTKGTIFVQVQREILNPIINDGRYLHYGLYVPK